MRAQRRGGRPGASVALLCDVIVMADTAVVVDPHVQVGLVAGDGGAAIWPLLLGPLAAKRHLMLGDPLGGDDALRLGVAAEVCPAADVVERRDGLGATARRRRAARRAGHQAGLNAQLKQALLTSFDLSTALEIPCILSADHAEAVDAFVAGRRAGVPGTLMEPTR